MNSDLLKRLFKAINQDNVEAINKIAQMIIKEEQNKGHYKLAEQLQTLLNTKAQRARGMKEATNNNILSVVKKQDSTLIELPTSKRDNTPLFSFIEHSKLRHHMILPTSIETKFTKIEAEYTAQERLMKYNLKPIKKILLYGESGCGKTMSAERLAWNIGLPLLKVRFDSLLSSYFGESASNLRTIFDTSITIPCVLLIDECDFIATARNSGRDIGEASRIVNMFLQLLDEYEPIGLIVATTNLKNKLDKALFRRFDESFEMMKPSLREIESVLKMTLSSIKTCRNFDWIGIAEKMQGMSYAEIVKIAQNSAKNIILSGKHVLDNQTVYLYIKDSKMNS